MDIRLYVLKNMLKHVIFEIESTNGKYNRLNLHRPN